MRRVAVHKADAIAHREETRVDPVAIEVSIPLPRETKTLEELGAAYDADAIAIADALEASLPQATRQRLLVELLTRTPNFYRGR